MKNLFISLFAMLMMTTLSGCPDCGGTCKDAPIMDANGELNTHKLTYYGNLIIIENIGDSFRTEAMQDWFIEVLKRSKMINEDSDVVFLKDMVIVNQKKCPCEKKSSQVSTNILDSKMSVSDVFSCENNCSYVADPLLMICASMPSSACKIGCVTTVNMLANQCRSCCQSSSFYDNCIAPLESYFPPPCDYKEWENEPTPGYGW